MPQFRLSHLALAAALIGAYVAPVFIEGAATVYAADTVRPELGKVLNAAQDDMKKGKFKDALNKLHDADAIGGKSGYETYLVEATRASAAQQSGDNATAAKSYEAVINSGHVTGANQAKMVLVLGQIYYRAGDYAKAIVWLTRYQSESGDNSNHGLIVDSYFRTGDFAKAFKETKADIAAEEKAGRTPSPDQLDMLLSCANKLNDKAEYLSALEKYAAYRPTKEVWTALLARLENKQGFSNSRLHLDVLRLRAQLGTITTASDYMEFVELSVQANFPSEAKKAVDAAFKSGVFGSGNEAARQKRLQDLVNTKVAEDPKRAEAAQADAEKNSDGDGLLAVGFDYVTAGQGDKGLPLMEKGLAMGNLKHPDDAKLHMGIAYALAGKKAKALATLKTVGGTDGTADLARYWAMVVNHPL
ncbi:MAG: hypothetical protein JO002_04145 [Burkholderiaceae bacterium]|nr:hypothetical protein [Burkholderiaceae bacterium]